MAVLKVLTCILIFFYIIILETMKYLKIIPYVNCFHLDIFGVGATAGAGISAAAQLASTSLTNLTNKSIADANNETQLKIHEEDRQFNAQEAEKSREFNLSEAEKSREFNSSEAEKARQWNSETSIVERRKDAGLNTAVTGNGGTTPSSSAVASSSPVSSSPASAPPSPVLTTPVMQAPDIASSIDSGVRLAKATSEISNNKASAKKQLAETAHEAELTKQAQFLNEMTPAMNKLLLQKQTLDNLEKEVLIEYNQNLLDNSFIQGFSTYADIMLKEGEFNLDVNMFLVALEEGRHEMEHQALLYEQEWKQKNFENSFRYGISETKRKGWNVHAEGGVNNSKSKSDIQETINTTSETFNGKRGSTPTTTNSNTTKFGGILGSVLGVSGQLEGGYENIHQLIKNIQNEEYFQKGVEYTACLNILKNANYSEEIQQKARNRIREIQLSAEGYSLFVRQLGKYKRMPSNFINTVQDFEEQQIAQ